MKDELFLRGAQVPMTKEAVRALALAKLELHRARHLIDIGAGTGSVSIEAALQNPALRVTAIERQADALRLLADNRQRFGCDNIAIVAGIAPLTPERSRSGRIVLFHTVWSISPSSALASASFSRISA